MLDYIKGLEGALSIAALVLAGAATLHTWLTRPSKANADKIAELQAVHAELHGRVSDLEAVIENQPTREDFHKLTLKISEMGGQISTVSTELRAVNRIATRIDDYLLSQGGK